MQLAGDLTAISVVDLIHLLHSSNWEGTVRFRRSGETAMVVLQADQILFPVTKTVAPTRSSRRSTRIRRRRRRGDLRGNRELIRVCRWTQGSFRCFARQLPRDFIGRKALPVNLARLRKLAGAPQRDPSRSWETGVGLQGELLGRELPCLMQIVAQGHWSGVLKVQAPRAELEIMVHGRATYLRLPRDGKPKRMLIGPSETITVRWMPRPVPEISLNPEHFMRTSFGRPTSLQVA